jgi:hypothetical protein
MGGTDRVAESVEQGEDSSGDRRPVWVVVTGIVIAVFIAGILVMMLVGGGRHGPAQHMHPAEHDPSATMHMPPDHTPPPGMYHS